MKRVLAEKMQQEIPVITVAVVMGTTEESAVDPLTDVLDLRDEFRKQVSEVITPDSKMNISLLIRASV